MLRETRVPIHPDLARRYSPRSFLDREIGDDDLSRIIEAGRWAPSCFNEQPWALVYARQRDGEAWERLLSVLLKKNRSWAAAAPLLMVTAAKREFTRGGRENRHYMHDTGLMLMSMLVEGTALGIYGHPMAGFDRDAARELLEIPAAYEPVTAVAWGYPGPVDGAPEDFRSSEAERTSRRAEEEFAFSGRWGE